MNPFTAYNSVNRAFNQFANSKLAVEFQQTSNFTGECDLLILAVGQAREPFWKKFMEEQKPNLFLGGDFLFGPKTVAQAIGSGKEAAKNKTSPAVYFLRSIFFLDKYIASGISTTRGRSPV